MRAWIAVLAIIVVALAAMACDSPATQSKPHENPDTAPLAFDGVSLFQKYAEALEYIEATDVAGILGLLERGSLANVPPELRNTANDFLSSSHSLGQLIPAIEADLEHLKVLLSQFRLGEAEERAEAVAQKISHAFAEPRVLSKAESELQVMERSAQNTVQWWEVESAAEESELMEVYEALEAKFPDLRNRLDLFSETRYALAQQAELMRAISEGNTGRLSELRQLLAQGVGSEVILERIEGIEGKILRPTAITLDIQPRTAFVGDSVGFQGTLSAEEKPLAGRRATILLNGSPTTEALTDSDGAYHGQIEIPYQYVSEMTVQALYYPQGGDVGLYLGASSAVVTTEVLFYRTTLSITTLGAAYPGRGLTLRGNIDHGKGPIPESRRLQVYWGGELAAETGVKESFTLEFPVDHEAALGKREITASVTALGRHSPARAKTEVEVITAIPQIEVDTHGIVLLPFALNVHGKVHSNLGPLQDAPLRIALGDWEVTTRSRDDGTFGARLNTGMSLALVGTQELRVSVTPGEPWHSATSVAIGVMVLNPANIAGLALALAIPVFFGTSRVRRRAVPGPQPAPFLVRGEIPLLQAAVPVPEGRGSPRTILLALYRGVLRLVQRVTAVVLRPSHTLREFAQECTPGLGPLAGYFQEFTLIMEKLLYSRYPTGKAEAARGGELDKRLKGGLTGEDA